MKGVGRHFLVDFYGCTSDRLNDPAFLRATTLDAARSSGATVMSHHQQLFEPHGVTVVVVVAESHLALHTWPEHGYAALDYFTCSDRIDVREAIDHVERVLRPARTYVTDHARGEHIGWAFKAE